MIIYSPIQGPRLKYISDFIGDRLFGQSFILTGEKDLFVRHSGIRINYSDEEYSGSYQIRPGGLLTEEGIKPQQFSIVKEKSSFFFFQTGGDHPFDIFSACFYLLSRYEEYLSHQTDTYGRYAHTNSIAFNNGFLQDPLVDQWIQDLRDRLILVFPEHIKPQLSKFQFIPTYDIDEAWSYRYKPGLINLGGMVKDLLRGQIKKIRKRIRVRTGKLQDPFDSYDLMDALHHKYNLDPVYFFLVAGDRSRYDKNISPSHPAFRRLVGRHAEKYKIGIHPSWRSGDDKKLLQMERARLEAISGKKVTASRQHFIRLTLPQTYRELLTAGIREDYSMGYGSINGFRASVAAPFYWYDLENERPTELKLYPFCFMDANAFFEEKLSPEAALAEMKNYYKKVRAVNGTFISIWHNTFLGTDPLFTGWREVYENFLAEKS